MCAGVETHPGTALVSNCENSSCRLSGPSPPSMLCPLACSTTTRSHDPSARSNLADGLKLQYAGAHALVFAAGASQAGQSVPSDLTPILRFGFSKQRPNKNTTTPTVCRKKMSLFRASILTCFFSIERHLVLRVRRLAGPARRQPPLYPKQSHPRKSLRELPFLTAKLGHKEIRHPLIILELGMR